MVSSIAHLARPITLPFPASHQNAAQDTLGSRVAAGLRLGDAKQALQSPPIDGIALLRERLNARLNQAGFSELATPKTAVTPPTAAQVANRVLGFIENRLDQAQQDGASTERLNNLLAQARKGVEQGFSDAREQIAALGKLDDQLSSRIDDSFSRISDGLDQLAQRFNPAADAPAVQAPLSTGSSETLAAAITQKTQQKLALEVVTQEGDRVKIVIDERRFSDQRGIAQTGPDGTIAAFSSQSSFQGRYRISVEGQLNQDEQAALNDLFAQVDDISSRFFGGDVQSAFEQAQSLNLDGQQLASFALNLKFSQVTRASSYSETANQTPSIAARLQPAAGLARGVEQAASQGAKAGLAIDGLQKLLDRLLADGQTAREANAAQNPARFNLGRDFIRSLLDTKQA